MGVPFVKIIHKDSKTDIETNITQYYLSISINLGSEATKNTVNIELSNKIRKLIPIGFSLDDSIIVYIDNSPIVDQNPIISSFISNIESSTLKSKKSFKLKCVDKTFLLLSKLWAKAYVESDPKKANEVVINVIQNTTDTGVNTTAITYNNVASVKSDGTPFDINVNLAKAWKPLYEWLKELATPTFTGDNRTYIFYIDKDNDLHWEYPHQKVEVFLSSEIISSDTTIPVGNTLTYPEKGIINIEKETILYTGKTSTSFTGCTRGYNNTQSVTHPINTKVFSLILEEGRDNIESIIIGQNNDKSVNFIIYNAGPTPDGYDYLFYKFDESSADKEFRMAKREWKGLGQDLINQEKSRSDWTDKNSSFPPSYPWTPLFKIDVPVVINSDNEYQNLFVEKITSLADIKASSEFSSVGAVKYKSNVKMKGSFIYTVNDLVQVVAPSQGITKNLRIKSIAHSISRAGFGTTIGLEEDEEIISNG